MLVAMRATWIPAIILVTPPRAPKTAGGNV
jgi:hypothetical protein